MRINYSERERLVSIDHNREQALRQRQLATLLRHLCNVQGCLYDEGGTVVDPLPPDVSSPLRADIFEGLVVEPFVGTTSVKVNSGIIGIQDPDGQAGSSDSNAPSSDDSPYKIVTSSGVSTQGVLTIASNADPSIRIDVIECRRNPSQTVETDDRDIFNTSLGAFVPTAGVIKVVEGQLEFGVRQGTPGSGYPGNVQGWLPLSVASIPGGGGGVTTDDVTFWDVRPLVADRLITPHRSDWGYNPGLQMQQLYGDLVTGGGAETRIAGHVHTSINGIRAGGKISRGVPGADQGYIDAQDSDWHEPGFAVAIEDLIYLYLAFPFFLPRWVRSELTPSGGRRLPKGLRGIPVISATGPDTQSHELSGNAITMPASTGLGATTTREAACVLAAPASAANVLGPFVADGGWVSFGEVVSPPIISPPTNGTGQPTDDYTLVAGVHYPANARAIRVVFSVRFTGVVGNELQIGQPSPARLSIMHPGTTSAVSDAVLIRRNFTFTATAGGSVDLSFTADIGRIPEQAAAGSIELRARWNDLGSTGKSNEFLRVIGWKQIG